MEFERELNAVLPLDLPNRSRLISIGARHLALIHSANEHMNLTRIVDCREAVIKHVLDSVSPWLLFEQAATVLDAGTGAGFPGIPLAAIFPDIRFVLADSTQKKARFVENAAAELGLENVEVSGERAEDLLRRSRFHLITARAVAPLDRALTYFAAGLKSVGPSQSCAALLYKGPDVENEIKGAALEAHRRNLDVQVVMRYQLPDALGVRTIVRVSPK